MKIEKLITFELQLVFFFFFYKGNFLTNGFDFLSYV